MKKYIRSCLPFLVVIVLGILIPSCGKDDEETRINENVKFPEENADLLNVIINGDTLNFIYKSGSSIPTFQQGDIVVGQKSGGYLKEVQSTSTKADTLVLFTEQAALTDAIEIGSIDTIIALQLQGQLMSPIIIDTIIQGKSGKSYRCKLTGGQPQLIPMGELFEIRIPDITIDIMSGSNVAVRVHVDTLVLTKSIDIDLNLIIDGGTVEVLRLVADATDEVRFAGTTMDVYQTISDDIELLLVNLNLGTVVIWIGPVPVVFLFSFDIYAGVDASVTVSAHTTVSNDVSLTSENQVGAEYLFGQWQVINDWTLTGNATFNSNPTASITAYLLDYLRGALSVKVYGVLGPSLYLKPYQYNTLSYPPLDYELGVGLAAGLDFKVRILSWALADYNYTFLDYSIPLYNTGNSPPYTPSTPSGPSSGNIGTYYTFSSSTSDPEGDSISIRFAWGDSDTSSWSSYRPSGSTVSMSYAWSSPGTYYIRSQARDIHGGRSSWSSSHSIVIAGGSNSPPYHPVTPYGPSNGNVGTTYTFHTWAIDPDDGDSVAIRFAWGDADTSSWSAYFPMGTYIYDSHAWLAPGYYSITAQAKDNHNATSTWSDPHDIYISGSSQTVTIQPGPTDGKDTYVYSGDANGNYGNDTLLHIESWQGAYYYEALIQFPLSSIPGGAIIDSARLHCYGDLELNDPYYIKEVLVSWNENTVTWSNKPPAGGTISTVIGSGLTEWYSWPVTSLVQDWVNGSPNYGMFITTPGYSYGDLMSSDYTNASFRPKLVVTYH